MTEQINQQDHLIHGLVQEFSKQQPGASESVGQHILVYSRDCIEVLTHESQTGT